MEVPYATDNTVSEIETNGDANSARLKVQSNQLERKFQCKNCMYASDNFSHLKRHVLSKHSVIKPYACYVCDKEYTRMEKMTYHFFCAHPDNYGDFSISRTKRDLDYNSFILRKNEKTKMIQAPENSTQWNLQQNIAQVVACYICTWQYSGQGETMVNHFKIVHPDSVLDELKLVKVNVATTSNERVGQYAQKELDKAGCSASTGPNLFHGEKTDDVTPVTDPRGSKMIPPDSRHSKAAQAKRGPYKRAAIPKFTCEVCGKVFPDKYHKERHLSEVHRKEKPYKCPTCLYATCRKHRIVSHMKRHGELKCLYCDYVSRASDDFDKHMKVCNKIAKVKSAIEKYRSDLAN